MYACMYACVWRLTSLDLLDYLGKEVRRVLLGYVSCRFGKGTQRSSRLVVLPFLILFWYACVFMCVCIYIHISTDTHTFASMQTHGARYIDTYRRYDKSNIQARRLVRHEPIYTQKDVHIHMYTHVP